MDFKKLFRKDEKAVSPVIGVILMVAITVILAAAIGSSVFNQNPVQTASKASINVKAVTDTDGSTSYIIIEHLGGDKLEFGKGGNAKLTASFDGGTSIEIDTSNTGIFSAGDVKQIKVVKASDEAGDVPTTINADDAANIKITDIATNQVVCDRDVRFVTGKEKDSTT